MVFKRHANIGQDLFIRWKHKSCKVLGVQICFHACFILSSTESKTVSSSDYPQIYSFKFWLLAVSTTDTANTELREITLCQTGLCPTEIPKSVQPLKNCYFLNQEAVVSIKNKDGNFYCELQDNTTRNLLLMFPVSLARSFDKDLQKNHSSGFSDLWCSRLVFVCWFATKDSFLTFSDFTTARPLLNQNADWITGKGNEAISINVPLLKDKPLTVSPSFPAVILIGVQLNLDPQAFHI